MQTVKYLCHKPVANRHHHQHHINASALPRFWLNLFSVWGNSGCFSTAPKTSPPSPPSLTSSQLCAGFRNSATTPFIGQNYTIYIDPTLSVYFWGRFLDWMSAARHSHTVRHRKLSVTNKI